MGIRIHLLVDTARGLSRYILRLLRAKVEVNEEARKLLELWLEHDRDWMALQKHPLTPVKDFAICKISHDTRDFLMKTAMNRTILPAAHLDDDENCHCDYCFLDDLEPDD